MNLNSIIFKGTPDGILIILDEKISFSSLKEALIKKLEQNSEFFKEATTSITFKGRVLSEEEEIELIKTISKHSEIDISFVKDEKSNFNITKKELPNENQANVSNEESRNINSQTQQSNFDSFIPRNMPQYPEMNTYYHKGSVRGGQCLKHNGSIVVIGDVNPGSKIIAEGNIIILGKLKGIVHAGCNGMKDCFVSALFMQPTQLIINDVITYFPNDIKREMLPEYAYEKDGKIFVEELIKI